ncbi:unnamed protein product, partial [Sphacelaria rigidula]
KVDRLTIAAEALMSVSDLLYSRITQKRYRDVSVHVRCCVLDGLAAIMLALPEVYVQVRCVGFY